MIKFVLWICLILASHQLDYDKEYIEYKEKLKEKIIFQADECLISTPFKFLRNIDQYNDPKQFFCEDHFESNINRLPLSGTADTIPWSGSYWPLRYGGISARYCNNEKNTIRHIDSKGNIGSFYTYNVSINLYSQPEEHNKHYDPNDISSFQDYVEKYYSPSEKYDILIGDSDYTLTNTAKAEGDNMIKTKKNDVPDWMGKCHGWAPASYLEKRPLNKVTLTAADGLTKVKFYPDDIKALLTVYWAENSYKSQFVGGRCKYVNLKEVPSDKNTGLWEDPICFSINPGTLTITLSNQIGLKKKNLVFDPNSNGEIWNHPVYSYEMNYFNIMTNQEGDLNDSKVPLTVLKRETGNLFIQYLMNKSTGKTKSVVGVKLSVHFVSENDPSQEGEKDVKETKKYNYVIELDENDEIIGGEWMTNKHPIFIWNASDPLSEEEIKFKGSVEELNELKQSAIEASSRNTVLRDIVKYLLNLSTQTN